MGADLLEEFANLYALYPKKHGASALADVRIALRYNGLFGNVIRRRVQARIDGHTPFEPVPRHFGVPILELSINWFIATQTTRFLLVHAAVVERDGVAVLMPGVSGAGKSTLCSALIARGWRLLSDEFAMVRPRDGLVQPHPRPISLKNESIELIARRMPDAYFSQAIPSTSEGTLAFVRAPQEAIVRADEPARPILVVFPRYGSNAQAALEPMEKASAFMKLVDHSLNYFTMLDTGFETLGTLVDACDHFVLPYHALDDAIALIEKQVAAFNEVSHVA